MIDYELIGKRLKEARISKKMTQDTLAKKINVSIAFLSRIETESSQINLKRLTQICNILNVTEGEILNGVSKESKNYLEQEFENILSKCSKEQKELIYKISRTIIE